MTGATSAALACTMAVVLATTRGAWTQGPWTRGAWRGQLQTLARAAAAGLTLVSVGALWAALIAAGAFGQPDDTSLN